MGPNGTRASSFWISKFCCITNNSFLTLEMLQDYSIHYSSTKNKSKDYYLQALRLLTGREAKCSGVFFFQNVTMQVFYNILKTPLNWRKWNVELKDLCEMYPNTEFFLVRIFLHSDWIRRDTSYLSVSLHIQSKCGKVRTRKKSVFGYFPRSE